MHVCMYVSMYICVYVRTHAYTYISSSTPILDNRDQIRMYGMQKCVKPISLTMVFVLNVYWYNVITAKNQII